MGCKFFLVRSIGSAATDYSGSIFPRNGLFICLSGDFKLNARPRGFGLAFCVVGCRIERTKKKYEFCTLVTVLWRSRRSHGATISERIEKVDFLAFQRCGNASFRPERPYQLKNPRFEGWDYPNRPRRIEWKQKIRGSFVW